MSYLSYKFEDNENFITTFDEAPLWSAAFGLLLFRHLDLRQNMKVVDLGCGAGFPLFELAGRLGTSGKVYGIDPWKNAMARARIKHQNYGYNNVELLETSAEKIPLEDNSIDLVVSNLGINNFENPPVVFKECNRVLRKKGKLALTTNVNGHWKRFYEIFENTLREKNKSAYLNQLAEQQAHRGTVESISKMFTDAGFTVTKIAEDNLEMKFADGTAFLNHHFVKPGWLGSWLDLIPEKEREELFSALEKNLNKEAKDKGALVLNVPMVYAEGKK